MLALANMTFLTCTQALPALVHATSATVVFCSTFLVSVQVGQAVGMQYGLRYELHRAVVVVSWVGISLGGAVEAATNSSGVATAVVIGVLLGVTSVAKAIEYLSVTQRTIFQSFMLTRNALWLCSTVALAVIDRITARTYVLATIAAWLVSSVVWLLVDSRRGLSARSVRAVKEPNRVNTLAVIFIGCAASLLYRNDSNILRARYLDSPQFLRIHWILLIYTAVNAGAGFYVIQVLYPRYRTRNRAQPDESPGRRTQRDHRWTMLAAASAALLVPLAFVLDTTTSSIWWEAVILVPILAFTVQATLMASRLHAAGRSLVVYGAGVSSIGILLIGLELSGYHLALVMENVWLTAVFAVSARPTTRATARTSLARWRSAW